MNAHTLLRAGLTLCLSICLLACQTRTRVPTSTAERGLEEMQKIEIKSSAFQEGGIIPRKYTCDAEDISPPLSWTAPPAETKSLVLICDDPDAPVGTWVHWVLYNLPPDVTELPEGVPPDRTVLGGAMQGTNDFRKIGYGGPCPPRGPAHRYFFKLYAVDFQPELRPGMRKKDVLKAIEGHILAQGQLMGRYKR